MKEITIGTISFPDLMLDKSQIPAFRGAVAGQFRQFDLLHNHTPDGKVLYRYSAIQFKIRKQRPVILAVGEKAVEIFKPLFLNIDKVNLNGRDYPVLQKQLKVRTVQIGISEQDIVYRLCSPWLALNQENFDLYKSRSAEGKMEMLKGIAINNIICFAKFTGYTIPDRLHVDLKLNQAKALLKGETLTGFTGLLKTNFLLPDGLGLGKSISRGYGVVERVF